MNPLASLLKLIPSCVGPISIIHWRGVSKNQHEPLLLPCAAFIWRCHPSSIETTCTTGQPHPRGVRGQGRYRNDIIVIHPSISLPVAMAIVPDCQRWAVPDRPKKPLDMNPVACCTLSLLGHSTEIKPSRRVWWPDKARGALWPWQRPKLRPTTGSNRTYFKPEQQFSKAGLAGQMAPRETEKRPFIGMAFILSGTFLATLDTFGRAGVMLSTMGPDRPVAETFQEATIFEGFLAIMLGRLGGV